MVKIKNEKYIKIEIQKYRNTEIQKYRKIEPSTSSYFYQSDQCLVVAYTAFKIAEYMCEEDYP
ncbi:hypothetical protein PaeCFBP13512_01665 [Paenibacillus sp. CFBP13512]|nr:hypothetical protein PaeCFBP13512_01665 [Paenibacillus sp. CFBP13512]